MPRLLRCLLVPMMLLALAGCQATEKKTCCVGCGKSVAAQQSCEKAKLSCEEKRASGQCEKKKACSKKKTCDKKKATCEKKKASCGK